MGKINNLSEPWDGRHSGDEIETFLKEQLTGLDDKIKELSSNTGGFYVCTSGGSERIKQVDAPNYALEVGGGFKIKMNNENTVIATEQNPIQLKIGNAEAKTLYYNGELASDDNTWSDNDVVEVYYDGSDYYANNVKGGGGSLGASVIEMSDTIPGMITYTSTSKALDVDDSFIDEQTGIVKIVYNI